MTKLLLDNFKVTLQSIEDKIKKRKINQALNLQVSNKGKGQDKKTTKKDHKFILLNQL